MTFIWTGKHGYGAPDLSRCRASVTPNEPGGSFYAHQCNKKATRERVINGEKYGFCGLHDPDAVKARADARSAAYREESARKDAKWQRERDDRRLRPIYEAALRLIADGHNDARAVAAEALGNPNAGAGR